MTIRRFESPSQDSDPTTDLTWRGGNPISPPAFPTPFEVSTREAYLPAEQARAQAAPWLPLAHGDRRRPQGDCRPSQSRPQAAFGLSRALHRVVRLQRRPEFLAAARGRKAVASSFVLQACPRPSDDTVTGVGFTVTRKIGGAVVRNRTRRRLREAARQVPVELLAPGFNYVLVARPAALTCPFQQLRSDLETCLRRLGPASSRAG